MQVDNIFAAICTLADATGISLEIDKSKDPWQVRGSIKRETHTPLGTVTLEIVSSHILDSVDPAIHAVARGPGKLSFLFQATQSSLDCIVFDNAVSNLVRTNCLEYEARKQTYDPLAMIKQDSVRAVFKATRASDLATAPFHWTKEELEIPLDEISAQG